MDDAQAKRFARAFATLPVEQRRLLWLDVVEEQAPEVIAAALDVPEGEVGERCAAARAAVRAAFDQLEDAPGDPSPGDRPVADAPASPPVG